MKHLKHHRPVSPHAWRNGRDTDPNQLMTTTIEIRRRLDHARIPDISEYVNTYRPRIPADVFAAMYGASDEDIQAVHDHYAGHGMSIVERHNGRRHVTIQGTIAQHCTAFQVDFRQWNMDHYGKIMTFDAPQQAPMIPDHLEDVIICLHNFGNEPVGQPCRPAVVPATTQSFTAAQVQLLYHTPTTLATNQHVAVGLFSPEWGAFSQAGLNTTCSIAGVPVPTVNTIVIDAIGAPTAGEEEIQLDCSMVALFGAGCAITIYTANSVARMLSRIAVPNAGDPIITIVTNSIGGTEFYDASLAYADCVIQGVTVLQASGDWGSSNTGFGSTVAQTANSAGHPYITMVGQTVIGNVSQPITANSTFVEWLGSDGNNLSGGGVSVIYPQPNYQNGFGIPASLSTTPATTLNGAAGWGVPDISAIGSESCGVQFSLTGGSDNVTGAGTSQAAPLMAGVFARINAALGHNIGYINPTLYAIGSGNSIIRDINTSTGGDTSNANYNSVSAGYPVTTGWDACTGLGVIHGQNFLTYLQTHNEPAFPAQNYYVQVIASNVYGNSAATIGGPFPVVGSI